VSTASNQQYCPPRRQALTELLVQTSPKTAAFHECRFCSVVLGWICDLSVFCTHKISEKVKEGKGKFGDVCHGFKMCDIIALFCEADDQDLVECKAYIGKGR